MAKKTLKISLIDKPKFEINQKVYVPQKNSSIDTSVRGYCASVLMENGRLKGFIDKYALSNLVIIREGNRHTLADRIHEKDLYTNKQEADRASRFICVDADEESWKLAIGDRDINDLKSRYHIDNSNLPPCCNNISSARDLLQYCKLEKGLIVHYRDELKELLSSHEELTNKNNPLRDILKQLGIITKSPIILL